MMRRTKWLTLVSAHLIALVTCANALDIPLTGGSDTGTSIKIGFVDMDKIFQVYPQTQSAKEDYAKQLKKKREQLAAKESELKEIEGKISVLESTMKQGASAPPPPTDSADPNTKANGDSLTNVSQSVDNMKRDLDTRKQELEDLRKQAKADLATFESQQSQLILGKIYQALRDVAVEEQVTVVVDKASILYGDASIDLTDKLQQRVRGY